MKVSIRNNGDITIADLEGRLVAGVGDEVLRSAMKEFINAGRDKILLNLAGVSRIDSSGVGELVASIKRAERAGAIVKLVKIAPEVQHILNLSRILPLFDFCEDEEEALLHFQFASKTPGAD